MPLREANHFPSPPLFCRYSPPPVSSDRISTFPTYTSLRAFNCPASRGKRGRRVSNARSLILWCWRPCRRNLVPAGAAVTVRVPTPLPHNQRTDSLIDFQRPPLISCRKGYQTDGPLSGGDDSSWITSNCSSGRNGRPQVPSNSRHLVIKFNSDSQC